MSTGAKVVAWAVRAIGREKVFATSDADMAQRLDCSGLFAVDPLIRQADHLAELQAARKEGRREGLTQARSLCWAVKSGRPSDFKRGCDTCAETIEQLLKSVAPPPPDNPGQGG